MKNERILIVEDDKVVAQEIKQQLTNLGYTVVGQASTSEQAVHLAVETVPDLILMDIHIQGPKDGIATAEEIRSKTTIPILYLAELEDEHALAQAELAEASGYVLKPFRQRELAIAVELALYKHKMEHELHEREERFKLAILGNNDGIWDWDLKNDQIFISQRWKNIFGLGESERNIRLQDWLTYVHPEDREHFKLSLDHHLEGLTDHLECEVRMLHTDGSIRWVLIRGLAVFDETQRPYRFAGSVSDITDQKKAEQQLIFDANHDALTGIPNRTLFFDRLERAFVRYRRYKKNNLAVLFLDLDNFKIVNDRMGHQMGDKLLVQVANRLVNFIRASDTVARLGGDEFVILLESVPGVSYACSVAERILELLNTPIHLDEYEVTTSASIGIVMLSEHYQNATEVLHDADIAMYRAKALGKSRYEVFNISYSTQNTERMDIEKLLKGALGRQEFHVHFQPIYSFPNRNVVGLEALLRFLPQGQEPIPPRVFIPVAEEIGLMNEIGDWVLEESCAKMSDWHRRYPNESKINLHVNISINQLRAPNFATRVQAILKQTGLNPNTLKLEIPEAVFVENIAHISTVFEQLSALGIQLMIDDFGTSYSSLGYIRRFPIDTIKLDPKFIFPTDDNGNHTEIIKAVLALATQLGLETVAEGIETEEQADYLMKLKFHFGQGFLFSKPLEMSTLEQLLEHK